MGGEKLKTLRINFIILSIIFVLCMSGCTNKQQELTVEELISLGEKYLLDSNYEQALVQFNKVIEIEPMNPHGYIGAAEAYVGLEQIDKAIAILQKGFEQTQDDEVRNMLHALALNNIEDSSENINEFNLTGEPPFSYIDLEIWGYPWGMDVFELQNKGLISDREGYGTIDDWVQSTIEGPADFRQRGTGSVLQENPSISVYSYNFRIMSVDIGDNDTTIGPRGVKIGMPIEEVVMLFRCDNIDALEFAKNPLSNTSIEGRFIDLYTTYPENIDGMSYDGSFSIQDDGRIFLYYRAGIYDPKRFPGENYSKLNFSIKDGTVSQISVSYYYE